VTTVEVGKVRTCVETMMEVSVRYAVLVLAGWMLSSVVVYTFVVVMAGSVCISVNTRTLVCVMNAVLAGRVWVNEYVFVMVEASAVETSVDTMMEVNVSVLVA
jgi:hypothetical protein